MDRRKGFTRFSIHLVLLVWLSFCAGSARADHVWHSRGGHQYALTLRQATWVENQAEAISAGGHLVTINDEAENAWLATTFQNIYCANMQGDSMGAIVQIGYYFNASSGMWEWASGEPVTYTSHYYLFPQGGIHAYLHVAPHPEAGTWNANPPHCEPEGTRPAYGVIEVVPEPATLMWLTLGSLAAGCRRPRTRRS